MVSEKKDRRVSVRVAQSDYKYLDALARMAGMTVSQYVRMMVQTSITAVRVQESQGRFKFEDIQAILDD